MILFVCDLYVQFSSLLSGPHRIGQRLKNNEYFIAGALTGFVSSFAESPIDLVSHSHISLNAFSGFILLICFIFEGGFLHIQVTQVKFMLFAEGFFLWLMSMLTTSVL